MIILCYSFILSYKFHELKNQYLSVVKNEIISTGKIIDVYLGSDEVKVRNKNILDAIRLQSLTVSDGDFEIEKMDSQSFEGICKLVFNADVLFPIMDNEKIEGSIDKHLNLKLSAIKSKVNSVAMNRAIKMGGRVNCPGFNNVKINSSLN